MIKFLKHSSIYLNLLILTLIIGSVSFIIEGFTLYSIITSINDNITISDVFKFINGNWVDNMFVKYDGTVILENKTVSIQTIPIVSILMIDYMLTIAILFIAFLVYFIKSNNELHDNHLKASVSYASIIRDQHVQFLAENISHEISTPISVIESYVRFNKEQLSGTYDKGCRAGKGSCPYMNKYIQYMSEIQKNINVIKTILDRLSSYKTVKYGKNVPLYELFEFCRNSLSISKLYNFKIAIDDDLKLHTSATLGSADLISIFTNMMKNSIEAGATDISILFEHMYKYNDPDNPERDSIIITFLDNGSGIKDSNGNILPESEYNKIFKPYFSVKNELTAVNRLISSNDGLLSATRGIGLFFTKSIIEEHGGWIKVANTSTEYGTAIIFKIYSYTTKEFEEIIKNEKNEDDIN